eukprot:4419583-Prymnesium_polylepis.1
MDHAMADGRKPPRETGLAFSAPCRLRRPAPGPSHSGLRPFAFELCSDSWRFCFPLGPAVSLSLAVGIA